MKNKEGEKGRKSGLPALVLALTAATTGGCYAVNAPYAHLRIDAPNIGRQPAPAHKRQIVHYSHGRQLPPQDHSCNTYAATAADSRLPPERRTTITMCADGREWIKYPAPQPAPRPAPQPGPRPAPHQAPQPFSRAPAKHYAPQGAFRVDELTQEFWSEIYGQERGWSNFRKMRDGSTRFTVVSGDLQGKNPGLTVCHGRSDDQTFSIHCYIDGGDPTKGEFVDGVVDHTISKRHTIKSIMPCFEQMLQGNLQCMGYQKVRPHERHRKNQEYHRAARQAIRAHQRR